MSSKRRNSLKPFSYIDFEERPGYKRALIPERPGEVEARIEGGWSLVYDKSGEVDKASKKDNQMTSVIRRTMNRDPNAVWKTAVLMEIPIELYNEDVAEQQAALDEIMKTVDPYQITKDTYYGTGSEKHPLNTSTIKS